MGSKPCTSINGRNSRNPDRSILIAVTPAPGHVNPMLIVARHLRDSGFRVTFNTAEIFRRQVESAGLRFVPLTGKADFDYRRLDDFLPERKKLQPGPLQLAHDFKHAFGNTIPDQYRGIRQIMDETVIDLILADVTFMGTFPMLLGPRESRPPIIVCGVTPLLLSSIDISPFSGPDSSPEGRERNLRENQQFQAMFASVDDHMNRVLNEFGSPPLPAFFLDCLYTLPDRFLEFTAEAFEFPRGDMPSTIQFVGPVAPNESADFRPPDWWRDLDDSKPVILVTQGTIANTDLSQLVEPALAGLAGEDVTVVVALGRDVAAISTPVPLNARVASFIPFDKILLKVKVLVTNGGFGAVNQALSMGVPIVVAGTTEDKPFVAARVAWTGAGINLETDRPTSDQVRSAVHTVLCNGKYRTNAQALQARFAQYDALNQIAKTIDSTIRTDKADGKVPTLKAATRPFE